MKEELTQREKVLILRALSSYLHGIPEKIPKEIRNEYDVIRQKITSLLRSG